MDVRPFVVDNGAVVGRNVFARKSDILHPTERRNIVIGNTENGFIGQRLLFRFSDNANQLAKSDEITHQREQKTDSKHRRKQFYPRNFYGWSGQFGYFDYGDVGKIHRKIFDNNGFCFFLGKKIETENRKHGNQHHNK